MRPPKRLVQTQTQTTRGRSKIMQVNWHRIAVLTLSLGLAGCSTVSGWFDDDDDDPRRPADLVEIEGLLWRYRGE